MRNALLSAVLGACLFAGPAIRIGLAQPSSDAPLSERSIKAAYLYKFAGYVEWPDVPGGAARTLTIGVLESADMADELARITEGREINNRPVLIRKLESGDSLAGLHVLFVGVHDKERRESLLLPALELPILTVTESAGALADGSVINFTVDRERVRFEVSLPAAVRSRLKLSSRLLAVAQRVQRVPES